MTPRQVALSKAVARALRHAPAAYDVELDEGGWVPVQQLLAGLRKISRWADLTANELAAMVEASPKQRFELSGSGHHPGQSGVRIRALYGHSAQVSIGRTRAEPPPVLFHGTSRSALPAIASEGLQPMRRQFVHLSVDHETALEVARRKGGQPVVLEVAASSAHAAGFEFLRGNGSVWLIDHLPSAFLTCPDGSPLPGC